MLITKSQEFLMITSKNVSTYEPHSEERPDLVEQFLFNQEKVRQYEIAKEKRQIRLLIYCILIGTLSIPIVESWVLQAIEGKQCERNPIICQL